MLNLPYQNRLCADPKPAFSFWIDIFTVAEVRCDCQGLGLVARIEASILIFDTMQVLYCPVLWQIQLCSFHRRCKTCLDTRPVLYQDRFCCLTYVLPQDLAKSWSREIRSCWYFSNRSDMSVKFKSGAIIITPSLANLRLHEILR